VLAGIEKGQLAMLMMLRTSLKKGGFLPIMIVVSYHSLNMPLLMVEALRIYLISNCHACMYDNLIVIQQ
jgi:hypothetical protein